MNNWPLRKLSEICEKVTDGSHNPPKGIAHSEYLMLSSKNVFNDKIILDGPRYLKADDFQIENRRTTVSPGDVLLTIVGTVGRVAVVSHSLPKITLQRSVAVLKPRHDFVDARFLMRYLQSALVELTDSAQGVAQKGLYLNQIRDLNIPVPPIEEQRRIVAILDEAFACIDKAKANTEKNIQNARELFDSYLNNIFSNPGPDWETSCLEDSNTFIDYRGKTPVKTESGIRLITAKNVKPGYVTQEPEEFIAKSNYSTWMTRGIPKKGDILFTTEAPLANVAQLDTDKKVAFAQRIIILQPNRKKLEDRFLKYQLLSKPAQEKIMKHGSGATVQGIKAKLLRTVEISFPPSLSEQTVMADRLDIMWEECWNAEDCQWSKIEELEKLKKSILQKAFNGELKTMDTASAVQ